MAMPTTSTASAATMPGVPAIPLRLTWMYFNPVSQMLESIIVLLIEKLNSGFIGFGVPGSYHGRW